MSVGNGWHRGARKHPTMYILLYIPEQREVRARMNYMGQAITALMLRICGRVGSIHLMGES